MASRDERVAINEAMFRDANERIRGTAGELSLTGGNPVPFLCECADAACTEIIVLTIDDYERVRADPHTFAIVSGHQTEASETVLDESSGGGNGFVVVEKKQPGHEITERTDPRG